VFQPRAYTRGEGALPPPLELRALKLSNLKLKSEEYRKLVCCTFSALRRLYTCTRATMKKSK